MKKLDGFRRERRSLWLRLVVLVGLYAVVLGRSTDVLAQDQWATSGSHIYNTNPGNVVIGSPDATAARLTVMRPDGNVVAVSARTSGAGTDIYNQACIVGVFCTYWGLDATTNNTILGNDLVNKDDLVITPGGRVGIGTTSPAEKLTLFDGVLLVQRPSGSSAPASVNLYQANVPGVAGYWAIASRTEGYLAFWNGGLNGDAMNLLPNGNVGIGTAAPNGRLHVVGDAVITGTVTGGNIAAKYQDLAEWVPAKGRIAPGTVVVLDAERSNEVIPSSHPYDTRVAGVISSSPGILLGEPGEGRVKVATTGRVRVKVEVSRGPIAVGDLLVTSEKAGVAMRSEPLELAGVPIHRPGTILGKALQPLESGQGEILVLLSLQ